MSAATNHEEGLSVGGRGRRKRCGFQSVSAIRAEAAMPPNIQTTDHTSIGSALGAASSGRGHAMLTVSKSSQRRATQAATVNQRSRAAVPIDHGVHRPRTFAVTTDKATSVKTIYSPRAESDHRADCIVAESQQEPEQSHCCRRSDCSHRFPSMRKVSRPVLASMPERASIT